VLTYVRSFLRMGGQERVHPVIPSLWMPRGLHGAHANDPLSTCNRILQQQPTGSELSRLNLSGQHAAQFFTRTMPGHGIFVLL